MSKDTIAKPDHLKTWERERRNRLVSLASFEVSPSDTLPAKLTYLPIGTNLGVTCKASENALEKTIKTATALSKEGYIVAPCLPARAINKRELPIILSELAGAGIYSIFWVAGDGEEETFKPDTFLNSMDLIAAVVDLTGNRFEIGVAGHPAPEKDISVDEFLESLSFKEELRKKYGLQMYVETQISSPKEVVSWTNLVREKNIRMEIVVEVPGICKIIKLQEYMKKLKIETSAKFLFSDEDKVNHQVQDSGKLFDPEPFLNELVTLDTKNNIQAIRFMTVNAIASLTSWKNRILQNNI